MKGEEITIAVTVYDRRKYLEGSIRSALNQRVLGKHRVVVVEDCGPDSNLRGYVTEVFGEAIHYVRNPVRRGLFDNWNACIELCGTPWLCILHDDDVLEPNFISSMIELEAAAPERGLYYGRWNVIDKNGDVTERAPVAPDFAVAEPSLKDWARHNAVSFAGQMFDVSKAKTLGGFRAASSYTGDWDLWFRLAFHFGAAGTNRVVANFREHVAEGRGTTKVDVSGRKYAYVNMQRKKNMSLLQKDDVGYRFDRRGLQTESPMPLRWILLYGTGFSPRMLRYNSRLFLLSEAPHARYRLFQTLVRFFPAATLLVASFLYSMLESLREKRLKRHGKL